jgi:hypothetical protein
MSALCNSAPRKHHTVKRPGKLIVISIGWLIFGLFNIYSALWTITIKPNLPVFFIVTIWNILGGSLEFIYSIAMLCVGFFQVLTTYGLLGGKAFAYKFGLGIHITLLLINSIYVVLSLFAAAEGGFYLDPLFFGWFLGSGIVWVIIYWHYLREPSMKEFLGISTKF